MLPATSIPGIEDSPILDSLVKIPAMLQVTENEGSLTIPARMFTDFINSLPSGDQVDISNTEENKGIREVVARHHEHINTVAVDSPITRVDLNTMDDYVKAFGEFGAEP